jgi:methylenetetrahydrofolate dehydrogenase (NADP+) / methenyltetrahydrofolate cyclohydrolase
MQIISGAALAKEIKTALALEVDILKNKYGRAPKLSVVLVGENPDSMKYVKSKGKACADVGLEGDLHFLPESTTQKELLNIISTLNEDDTVDGILIQLPLPAHIDTEIVLEAVDYQKDADGLHPMNVGKLCDGGEGVLPCTPKGIISMLKFGNIDIAGKHAVVVGRSNLVGKPVAQMLLRENATVTVCHTKTRNLATIVGQADLLIAAMGCPNVLTPTMLKPGVVVIDVAMNYVNDKLAGDIYCSENLPELEKVVAAISPVPGGVGPMTITSLLENTFEIYKRRVGK